ncbi:MAG: UvrD-helicase domain-containing protein, partial [Acidobacteriota bacterium]
MTTIDFEETLNEGQYAAVTHEGPPQLVIAGAGSGKTRVITYRIAWLVKERGVDPSSCVEGVHLALRLITEYGGGTASKISVAGEA